MIQNRDLKPGNWISKKYPGCLLEARKIIEIDEDEDGVIIEDDKAYTLIQVGNKWEYNLMPQKRLLGFCEIKGIPLTNAILESCGFEIKGEIISMKQSKLEGPATLYLGRHSFILNFKPGPPDKFTHAASNSTIEFVHQLQNTYANYMNTELEITIDPYNYQLLSL